MLGSIAGISVGQSFFPGWGALVGPLVGGVYAAVMLKGIIFGLYENPKIVFDSSQDIYHIGMWMCVYRGIIAFWLFTTMEISNDVRIRFYHGVLNEGAFMRIDRTRLNVQYDLYFDHPDIYDVDMVDPPNIPTLHINFFVSIIYIYIVCHFCSHRQFSNI